MGHFGSVMVRYSQLVSIRYKWGSTGSSGVKLRQIRGKMGSSGKLGLVRRVRCLVREALKNPNGK